MKPRYSIVRIDNQLRCPTNLVDEFKCPFPEGFSCVKCAKINGDSKEQLINKITTALRRTWLNEDNQSFREVAEEIIEFLGVK